MSNKSSGFTLIGFVITISFLVLVAAIAVLLLMKAEPATSQQAPVPDRFEVVGRQELRDDYYQHPTVILVIKDRIKGTCQTLAVRAESATPLNPETPCGPAEKSPSK